MAAIEDTNNEGSGSDSDQEGFFMADFFTKDLDIEDNFTYTYGEGAEELTLRLKGVAREFGQTVLGSGDGTGLTVWRGAQELNEYLWARRTSLVSGRRVLELGAGLGLVGLLIANLKPALNVVTDGDDDCMKRLHDNFVENGFTPAPMKVPVSELASVDSAQASSLEAEADPVPTEEKVVEGSQGPWQFTKVSSEAAFKNSGTNETSGKRRAVTVVAKMRWNEDEDLANARYFASLTEGVVPAFGTNGAAPPDLTHSETVGTYDLILAADVVYQVT
jgi:predicted nicotinamide N-methyase